MIQPRLLTELPFYEFSKHKTAASLIRNPVLNLIPPAGPLKIIQL